MNKSSCRIKKAISVYSTKTIFQKVKIMKKPLTTVAAVVFLLGCSAFSQKQNQTPSQVQAGSQSQTEPKANSFEMRLKEAKKPFNFLLVGKMKVTKGMESEYLKVEKGWMDIHNMLV